MILILMIIMKIMRVIVTTKVIGMQHGDSEEIKEYVAQFILPRRSTTRSGRYVKAEDLHNYAYYY